MAAVAAALVGGSMLSSASQLGSSLGTAAMQSKTARDTNTQNINFQKSVISQGESSFTELGLPRAMYWNGSTLGSANTLIHLGGTNFYESSGVNANLPYFSANPYSQLSHYARPNMKQTNQSFVSPNRPEPSVSFNSKTQGVTFNGLGSMFSGQTDRTGLGAGRYSAVPPPQLTYNSVGVGTSTSTSSKFTQANLNTNPMRWIRGQ